MSAINVTKTRTAKAGVVQSAVATNGMVKNRAMVERFAAWIGFIGAVGVQSAVMLACFRVVGVRFTADSLILPATIALLGLAMIVGGRRGAWHCRPALKVRPRLRLVGEAHPENADATRRTAA